MACKHTQWGRDGPDCENDDDVGVICTIEGMLGGVPICSTKEI